MLKKVEEFSSTFFNRISLEIIRTFLFERKVLMYKRL